MVAIRRRPKRSPSPIFSYSIILKVIIGLVVLVCFRQLWTRRSEVATPGTGGSDENSDYTLPKDQHQPKADSALHGALRDSRVRLGANKNLPSTSGQDEPRRHVDPEGHEHDPIVDEHQTVDDEKKHKEEHEASNRGDNEHISAKSKTDDLHRQDSKLDHNSIAHEIEQQIEKPMHHGENSERQKTEKPIQREDSPKHSADVKTPPDSNDTVLKKHGTGTTRVGYVVDLVHERKNPAYRKSISFMEATFDKTYYSKLEQKVLQKLGDKVSAVHACEKLVPGDDPTNTGDERLPRLELQSKCHDEDTRLVVYNGAHFPRHVCGHSVEPGSALVLNEDCRFFTDSVPPIHLLPLDNPPVSGHGMPPIQILTQNKASSQPSMDDVACDIPCQWESSLLSSEHTDRESLVVAGTKWVITSTDSAVPMEQTAYRHNLFYSTLSWRSSVPLSFFSFDKYDFRKAHAIDFDKANNAATSVLSEKCASTSVRRHKWMSAMQSNMKNVHFYGTCNHNTEVPDGMSLEKMEDRIELMKKDRIVLAFEESMEPYQITDIVWEALMSGAVPAILGGSNLEQDVLPKNAALYASNYNNWDEYAQFVQQVADDKALWESFQTWRTDSAALDALESKLNFTRTSPQCRLCRWAYSKRYGLGWNHTQQMVQPNHIPRELCVTKPADNQPTLVTQPFLESWQLGDLTISSPKTLTSDQFSCQSQSQTATITDGVDRIVWHHDGFTDMTVRTTNEQVKDSTILLRLKFDVLNHEGALFRHVHTLVPNTMRTPFISSAAIQDEQSKVTLLANFIVSDFRSPEAGLLELEIPTTTPAGSSTKNNEFKFRIITEDFNEIQDKLTEYYPSSYSEMVMKDFIDPLELFYIA